MAKQQDNSVTQFLNVDLELYSRSDLEPLVSSLGKKVVVLFAGRERGRYLARLELARTTRTADSTIRAMCKLIRGLPQPMRTLWDGATARDFSIGVQAGTKPHSCDFVLEAGTVQAVASLNARVLLTVYAPESPATVEIGS
jgi:hypothetical protein